ncbi:putative thaumatin [Medicago truncatula]|uniref:Putative thaumatin n=1 Tax=Medicago truncatula TaxID=3880 RepID=A0A396GWW6_MEDTR|nr:putative thaumatin [Medicago truncatula]
MSLIKISLLSLCLISAQAARFDIVNQCAYTVWPAATPSGGGRQLDRGQSWPLDAVVVVKLVIAVVPSVAAYPLSSTSNACNKVLNCRDSNCPDAYHHPNDVKTNTCPGGTNYRVVFCP